MRVQFAVNAAVLLSTAALIACNHASGKTADSESDGDTPVRVITVQSSSEAASIEAPGVLAPGSEVRLSFKVGGMIAALMVEEGQRVRRGQQLGLLDPREIDAAVYKTRSALFKAERDLKRARALYADSVATLEQVQNATTLTEVARSDYEAALFNQRLAIVIAPADGVVLARAAEPGELVAAGQTVLTLGQDGVGSIVRVALPDRDAVRVRIGDAAEVSFDAMPGRTFTGKVSQTAGAARAQTGTYAVEIALSAGPRGFNGLIGRARIKPASAGAVQMVPIEAINEADGVIGVVYVLAADGKSVRRAEVKLGAVEGDRVAVISGLDGMARVVTAGSAYLTNGARVKVVP